MKPKYETGGVHSDMNVPAEKRHYETGSHHVMLNVGVKKMKTWYTVNDGKIDRIMQTDDESPGPEWKEAPNDWYGNHGDKLEWFDGTMCRISDELLVKNGIRKDNRGRVYNINDRNSRLIYSLDEELAEDETKEEPLKDEPYQYFNKQNKKWVVDFVEKEKVEKESKIWEKQVAIEDAERRIQRSIRAKLVGTATEDDKQIFQELNAQIEQLRDEKRSLLSA